MDTNDVMAHAVLLLIYVYIFTFIGTLYEIADFRTYAVY